MTACFQYCLDVGVDTWMEDCRRRGGACGACEEGDVETMRGGGGGSGVKAG